MASEGKVVIYQEGMIQKKSPKGLPGLHKWQSRYFVLTNKALNYYKTKIDTTAETMAAPHNVIPLMNIVKCEYLPDKKIGCRFDLTMKNRRVYALDADSVQSAKDWVHKIKQAVVQLRADEAEAKLAKKKEVSDITPLQEAFFKAKYGDQAIRIRSDPKNKEEQKLSALMKAEFKSDAHVLRFLLTEVMDPKAGVWDFDVTTDADVEAHEKQLEVEQQKKDAAAAALATAQETVRQQIERNAPKPPEPSSNKTDDDLPPPPPPAEPGALTAIAVISPVKKVAATFSKRSLAGVKASSQPLDEGTKRVLEMLKTKEFVRAILPVFSAKDLAAHGLAVKVFWVLFRGTQPTRELAAEQFNNHVNFYCQGPRFTTTVRTALFTLLLTDKPTQTNVEKPTTTAFYMPAVHHLAWAPIFHCMQESDMEIRKQALEDVNTLLHDNFKNAKSIVRSPQWQAWIYLLLCDIPRHSQTATHKTVYAFLLNTITLIHYSYFNEDPDFFSVVADSLQALHLFAGLNNASAKVAHTILLALINKISSQKVSLTSDTNLESKRWQNIVQLFRLLRKFIFQTAYWRSTSAAEDEKESADDRKAAEDEKKRAAERERDGVLAADAPAPKAQQEERQKLIRLMEEQRRKQQEEFVLAKSRVLKSDKDLHSEGEPVITDYGIHWADDGSAHDLALIKKLCALFKMLHLDEFNPDLASPTMTATERNFLLRCKAESDFWKDCDTFLTILKRQYIDDRKLLTYRRLSFVIQGWMRTSSTSARESIISDMKYTLANKGASRPEDKTAATAASPSKSATSPAAAAGAGAGKPGAEKSVSGATSTASTTAAPATPSASSTSGVKVNKSKRDNDWG